MKIPFLALLLLFCRSAQAQHAKPVFGVLGAWDTQILGIEPLDSKEPDLSAVLPDRTAPGAAIGVFARWPIWKGLSFQPALDLAFVRNKVHYRNDGADYQRFADIEMPIHFVVTNRTERFPLQGTFLFGGRFSWNALSQNSDRLRSLPERLALDMGLGVAIPLHRGWHLQPEFVYSHGLNNIHDVENLRYDNYVGRMVRDRLSLRVLLWRER